MNSKAIKFQKIVIVFFLVFFFLGVFIFRDYGISWDEPAQREIGQKNYSYIFEGNKELKELKDQNYGASFEIALIAGEKIFKLSDTRSIYFLRHFANFSIFFIGGIFFYLLIEEIWHRKMFGLLGVTFLICSPRIFADSFYNSKDIIFMVFYLTCGYSLLLYFRLKSYKTLLFHCLCTALAISCRVAGISMLLATIIFQITLLLSYQDKEAKKSYLGKSLFQLSSYILITSLLTFLFWPILWENPLKIFEAIKESAHFLQGDTMLYRGEFVLPYQLPWHYIPTWILITTPISFVLFFFLGTVNLVTKTFKKTLSQTKKKGEKISRNSPEIKILVLFFLSTLPIGVAIFFHSSLYDAWRHFFFVYPFFLLVTLYGIRTLLNTRLKFFTALVLVLNLSQVITFMIKNHPYQNVYFNFLAGKDMTEISKNYEMDYWGLSYRKALEYLVSTVPGEIRISRIYYPVDANLFSLDQKDQDRIILTDLYTDNLKDIDHGDYFVSSNKWHPLPFPCGKPLYSVTVEHVLLVSVFEAKKCDFSSDTANFHQWE